MNHKEHPCHEKRGGRRIGKIKCITPNGRPSPEDFGSAIENDTDLEKRTLAQRGKTKDGDRMSTFRG